MTYIYLLTRMLKKASRQKVFRMISSAPDLKHILQKLNILGQRQIIQPVPVVFDYLGHFVPIYVHVTNKELSLNNNRELTEIIPNWGSEISNWGQYTQLGIGDI